MSDPRSVSFDLQEGSERRPKVGRILDPVEVRVLGALLEKQQTTPDQYPLTLNSLRLACNQSTNREPVMSLEDDEVEGALSRLKELGLVWRVHGSRATRWEHKLDSRWGLDRDRKAIITLLLLRGPQTPGELRTRAGRMFSFDSPSAVEAALEDLADESDPLVAVQPRRAGQKETRWTHLVGETVDAGPIESTPAVRPSSSLASRVESLEHRIEELSAELQELKSRLGD